MAKYYGYCYDENGKFTEMIPIDDKPIYEKQTFYREEVKEIVTEEKLCELHQSIEDGTYEPVEIPQPDPGEGEEQIPVYETPINKHDCPDCVMRRVDYETIQVPYEEDVIVGYEPDLPPNCTLEVCPWLGYEPVFNGTKWLKTVEPVIEEPVKEPTEVEKLKAELNDAKAEMKATQDALLEFLMEQAMKEMMK